MLCEQIKLVLPDLEAASITLLTLTIWHAGYVHRLLMDKLD